MKNEFVLAFNEVLEEKGLPKETILEALSIAMVSAYRKSVNASNAQDIKAVIDMEHGKFNILVEKEVVQTVQNLLTEVTLDDAKKIAEDAKLGDLVMIDSTPDNFGRVAAQTARQVIQQKIREAEHTAQYEYYEKQIGEIISGVVQAANARGLTIGLELKAEASMPRKEMITRERFRIHERIRALVADVKETGRGPQIILSRTHRDFLRRLLENEVPEIFHGVVEIRSIAREPGHRAKIAVSATQNGIDPVGACVGMRGVRIQAIVRELHDEKIDVIEWDSDPTIFIAKAISPARVNGVYLNESPDRFKNALVVVPEDQLSLAIGREGQNARLAAKLTGWRIDIKSLPEAISDWLFTLKNDEEFKDFAKEEAETIAQAEEIMGRKAEGRVIPTNDYDFLNQFNDRLERIMITKRRDKREIQKKKKEEALQSIPAGAFKMDLSESGLSEKVITALIEANIGSAGDLVLASKINPERILEVSGIGPKTLEKIEVFGNKLPEIVPEEEAIAEQQKPEQEPEAASVEVSGDEEITTEETATESAVEQVEGILEEVQSVSKEPTFEPLEEISEAGTIEKEVKTKKVEKIKSFEELFKLDLKEIKPDELDEDDLTSGSGKSIQKKKKKAKKSRRVEYDPDLNITISKKKHKRGESDWDNWEEEEI
ncbi:MAG: transcription termination/antitermination protein NusA [Anaerolineaceae bacterium]|nr:transcription termination/antitermination protein NusA [Anaerolineaceae bacterium]